MRPSRRGLPPLGAVVEEHPTERPWRRGRRCIRARCVGDQHAGHAPRVLGDHRLERSQRPPEDRAGGSPVHDPCLASARPHAQSEPGNFAVLRHRLPPGWRREPLHPCVGDRCLCSHPAILSVRFGRDLRGNPAWGTPRTRRVTASRIAVRSGPERCVQAPRRLQTLARSLPRTINGVLRTRSFPLPCGSWWFHTYRTASAARACALWRALRCPLAALRRLLVDGKQVCASNALPAYASSPASIQGLAGFLIHRRPGRGGACSTRAAGR